MTQKQYILAIDEGTTSTRAVIIDHDGQVIADSQREFTQYFPQPGWVEHDANEIWINVLATMTIAVTKAGIKPEQVAGIGITNQRETTVVWDKNTGLPIYHAIVWQSRQSKDITDQLLEEGYADMIHQKTGLIIDPYFSATKVRWILDHVPGTQERAAKGELLFGTINTWLAWKLSGGKLHITDYTNASRTMLFNLQTLTWDQDILDLLNIPRLMMPEVVSNSGIYGMTAPVHFFGKSIPISGMIGDQQSALFGQQATAPGMIKNTYGTGGFLVMNTGAQPVYSKNNLLTTIAYSLDGQTTYALEGSIFVAGSAIQWLRDSMKMIPSAHASEQAVKKSTSANEIYVVPAFTGLGAPYWDADARGAIFGITRGTTKYDFVKATLQSLAYQTRDVVDTMQKDTGIAIPTISVDGGATRNNYLMQFQADIMGIPIKRAHNIETTALGAAFLAGLATGFWQDMNELKQLTTTGQTFTPQMEKTTRNHLYQGWQRAVQATMAFKPN